MSAVTLCECFARDGLQHEPAQLPVATKRALIERFAAIGFQRVEATSYANPKTIAQFTDASELLQQLQRRPGVYYKATCANLRAIERALSDAQAGWGANELSLLVSATESHTQKNLRASRAEHWQRIEQMVQAAGHGFRLVGTVSMAFGCPFEGAVDPRIVIEDVNRFAQLGVTHVALGDTIGTATPDRVQHVCTELIRSLPEITLIAHFHDTRGTALVNCVAAYQAGVRYFDCAFGGVGGHPVKITYGEGHTGNVATEDLVNLFESMGIDTGIDLDGLLDTLHACEQALGRTLDGRVGRSGLSPLLFNQPRNE